MYSYLITINAHSEMLVIYSVRLASLHHHCVIVKLRACSFRTLIILLLCNIVINVERQFPTSFNT